MRFGDAKRLLGPAYEVFGHVAPAAGHGARFSAKDELARAGELRGTAGSGEPPELLRAYRDRKPLFNEARYRGIGLRGRVVTAAFAREAF